MKLLILLISILALVLGFEAYQRTKDLERLLPLAQAVSEAETVSKGAKDKAAQARDSVGQALIDLGHRLKGNDR